LSNRITNEQKANLKKFSHEIADRLGNNLSIIDTRQTTESIWRTVASNKPDLLVIDHLRYVKDKGENENKRQGLICEGLHDLAKSYDLAVLLLVQLNRGVEHQTDKHPQLSDLRDSGEIEETADNVLMIYRDSYYNPPQIKIDKDPTEVWVKKFRNGPTGIRIDLLFDKQSEWFETNPKAQVVK
jgi:replicative DNA helicase